MSTPPRFLITGGAGFIGSHTAELLCQKGFFVRIVDDFSTGQRAYIEHLPVEVMHGSIGSKELLSCALHDIDHVIHLAAKVSVPGSWEDPLGFEATNVAGFLNTLNEASKQKVKSFVFASSCAVYGSLPELPKKEISPIEPTSPYAATKWINEVYAKMFAEQYNLHVVGLRYFNVFGKRQSANGPYGAVIPKFVESLHKDQPLSVFGDGSQSRDFVSVTDVAAANLAAAFFKKPGFSIFNIGSGVPKTIHDLIDALGRLTEKKPKTTFLPERIGDVKHSHAEITQAQRLLGWNPEHSFSKALEALWHHETLSGLSTAKK